MHDYKEPSYIDTLYNTVEYYLPHYAVIKEASSTNKIHTVFNTGS